MKTKSISLFTLLFMLMACAAQARLACVGCAETSNPMIAANGGRLINAATEEIVVSGRVTEENGQGLPGAAVFVKGTGQGTVTDGDRTYKITLPDDKAVLVFTYIGFVPQDIAVKGRTVIDVSLKNDAKALGEVVVTALGIKREKRALGYSMQEVSGDNLSQAKEANVATTLAGKIAGVQVTRSGNGAGGSSRVVIRGANSLVGNSQPLYVIDGIPMDNSNINSPTNTGGIDYGDGISNINPEDIETLSVLKGPNAAALYGQRGSNGVILITTKTGKLRQGVGVKLGSDFSLGTALVLPDFQDEFGQGLDGNFTNFRGNDGKIYSGSAAQTGNLQGIPKMSAGRDRLTRGSWGPAMQGQAYEDPWGNLLSLTPQPNTFQKFFNTEKQMANNISVEGGNKDINYRLSYGNTKIDGYTPSNTLNRHNISLRTAAKITSKLEADVKVNYISQQGQNRPTVSDASDNPAYLFISQPRSMPLSILNQSAWTGNDFSKQLGYSGVSPGLEKTYATNVSTANPYWIRDHTRNTDDRQRLIGLIKLSYQFNKWIRLTAKTGTDFYTDQRFRYREKGTYASQNRNGDIREEVTRVRENNSDILLSLTPQISKDFSFSANLGANHQKYSSRTVGNSGLEFVAPNLYSINNMLINSYVPNNLTESSINSVYGLASVGFREYLFVDFSARNDWSSTLSPKNNSFFYPSVSASLVLSDALNWRSNTVSFLKVRASWAQAGSSGTPYQLTRNYSLDQYIHGGQPLAAFTSVLPDTNLKNELTTSSEYGLEARFLKNRLGLTIAFYNADTKNQILSVPISPSSAFTARRINAGEIRNHGVEITLNGTPVRKESGFSWDAAFNFSRNRNQVVSLTEGVPAYVLGTDRNVQVVATPGKPFGTIIGNGFKWLRDAHGNRLIDPVAGLPLKSEKQLYEIGNALPNWIGGFNNTLSYKGVTLSGLIDISEGGKIFSQSLREELIYGTIKKTVPGRDGTYVAEGVVAQKNAEGTWAGTNQVNAKQVRAQDYWNAVATDKDNVVSQEMLNDASYVMLRELVFNYQLPKTFTAKTPFRHIKIGVYGRNLFYFRRKTDGYAPEASAFNVNNTSLGLESASLPLLRYVGMSLNLEL